jgi:hypothetical protein
MSVRLQIPHALMSDCGPPETPLKQSRQLKLGTPSHHRCALSLAFEGLLSPVHANLPVKVDDSLPEHNIGLIWDKSGT